MNTQIEALLNNIKKDYLEDAMRFNNTVLGVSELSDNSKNRVDRFNSSLEYKEGKKYIKIISDRSAWGFVVATDSHNKFKRGDILKAASWSAPAMNSARGNVFEDYIIQWTGPLYLT